MNQAQSASAAYEDMSPSTLAQQPISAPDRTYALDEDWDALYAHLEGRLQGLRNWRYSWWVFWSVLAAFFIPFRYIWLVTANRMWRGGNLNNQIIDSTGLLAVRTCAAGMWTGLCSPSRRWLRVGLEFPWIAIDAETKAWLKDTEDKLFTVLDRSNFYTQMAQAFHDVTVFGTTPPICYEDAEKIVRFYLPCAGEYYLANGGNLQVNTLYREYTNTVFEMVDFFGLESCPQQVQTLWNSGGAALQQEFVVAHAIEPNYAVAKKRSKGRINVVPISFPWREVYWVRDSKTDRPLSKRGFHEQPFAALRWATVGNDAYGRSPCMDAICDNKQIQTETYRKEEFIEKGVRPPMGADPALKMEPQSTLPGMTTFIDTSNGKKGFWPLFEVNAQWLAGIVNSIEKVSQRIERCLFVDLFMAITRMEGVQPRNELELTKRDLERLQELGPVIDLSEKALTILIQRVIAIMMRRRLLKPMPRSLQGVPLKFEFISILRLAQRSAQSVSMKDVFSTAGALSSAAKAAGVPDPIRVLNLDEAMREYADINNYPQNCTFTPDEVKQHDQVRQQEMQKAQAPQQAMAAVTAAKTLSDTQLPGGNSALGAALGQGAPS